MPARNLHSIDKNQNRSILSNQRGHIVEKINLSSIRRPNNTKLGTYTQLRGPRYEIHKILPNDRYVIRQIDNCQTQIIYDSIVVVKLIHDDIGSSGQHLTIVYFQDRLLEGS